MPHDGGPDPDATALYVARLYGWDVDCEILQAMRHERDTATPGADPRRMQQLREEIFRTENHLVRGAERTIEGMTEMSVPRSYVERLESELNTLGWLARAPERIDDLHTNRQFLDKYEIHPGLPRRHSVPRRRRHSGSSTHGLSD